MKFNCHKNIFLEQIGYAKDIATLRDFNYSLVNIFFFLKEGKLYILSTNNKIIFKSTIMVEEEEEGSCIVNSKKIYEIIKYFPETRIQFSSKERNFEIYALDKKIKRKYTLYTSSNEGYPLNENNIHQKFDSNLSFEINIEVLKRIIKKTIYIMFIDEIRPFLNGVCFEKINNEINFIATDGKRLALIKVNQIKIEKDFKIIIPYKTLSEFSKMIRYSTEDEYCKILVNDDQILFITNDIELKSTLISGKYPDYNQVIPKNPSYKVKIEKEALLQTINGLSLMADQSLLKMIFEFNNKNLFLSSSSEDFGFSSDTIDYIQEVEGLELKIAFNYTSVIDLLKEVESKEVEIWLTDQKSPVLFKGVEDIDFYSIVAPMKIEAS